MCGRACKQTATQTNNPNQHLFIKNHPTSTHTHQPTNQPTVYPPTELFALDNPAEEDNDHVVFNGTRFVGCRLHQSIHSWPLNCTVIVPLTSTYFLSTDDAHPLFN